MVVDGAHNVASAVALVETLNDCFPAVSRTLIFGTTRDKDLPGQLRVLLPSFDKVVVTRYVENPRSVPPEEVASAIAELDGRTATVARCPEEALELARLITPPEAMICVTGSLFLAAETRAILLGHRPAPAFGAMV
jgi:dihydrofolate synthase/folylpolyglutamate synthase